jgi:hypothetical protein
MPKCLNPECGKKLPEGMATCNEKCMRRYQELNRAVSHKLTSEENVWFGQERRKRVMESIKQIARESCPISCERFASVVSYRTGLSLRKITDDYLKVLIDVGFLKLNFGKLNVSEVDPH